jgi:hypothetical protein
LLCCDLLICEFSRYAATSRGWSADFQISPLRRYRLGRGWDDSKVQPVRHHSRGRLCSMVVMTVVLMAVLRPVDLWIQSLRRYKSGPQAGHF